MSRYSLVLAESVSVCFQNSKNIFTLSLGCQITSLNRTSANFLETEKVCDNHKRKTRRPFIKTKKLLEEKH